MPKFKVGETVKVVKNVTGHEFQIGSHVTIGNEKYPYTYKDHLYRGHKGNAAWWVSDQELEKIFDPIPGSNCIF